MKSQLQPSTWPLTPIQPSLNTQLLANAAPDECFSAIGGPPVPIPPGGCTSGQPKANQAYVWGLTQDANTMWYGTGSNVQCQVLGGYLGLTTGFEAPDATNPDYVCELGDAYLVTHPPNLPAALGDFRPPHIYAYTQGASSLSQGQVDMTPNDPLIRTTLGMRSAGTIGNLVVLGGPSIGPGGINGINLFAYNGATGAYLGSQHLPQFIDIRKWYVAEGQTYAGVENADGTGSVLKWTGTVADPWHYDVVGTTPSEVAELVEFQGRVFVTTWPFLPSSGPNVEAGLYMSPPLGSGGLTAADASGWTRQWTASDYEPDPVTAATYGGGALAAYDGHLFWGTMHVPFVALEAHIKQYGVPTSQADLVTSLLGTNRAITIFEGSNFNSGSPNLQVAYGESKLPTYVPQSQSWVMAPTTMGAPLYGSSGFGNPFNNYTWSMAVYNNELFIGTMDWSMLLAHVPTSLFQSMTGLTLPTGLFDNLGQYVFGADMLRMTSATAPGVLESINGLGNYANYGLRNMVSTPGGLYVGTANPMNLMVGPGHTVRSQGVGGYELLKLTPAPPTIPGAPIIGTATAGNTTATVEFGPPTSDGGSGITSYTVTAADSTAPARGGQTRTGQSSPIDIAGLTNGDHYTFRVSATNTLGTGPQSAPSNDVVPNGPAGGYWQTASEGGVFAFGAAPFYGSMGGRTLNQPVEGIASMSDGKGYWQVASDGGVFSFGSAQFYGSMGGHHLTAPVVGITPTPDGKGYWEVASDGGIFAFGDATFYGSMGGHALNRPVQGIAATPDGKGYWEVASDGGIFAFGDAHFHGSMGGHALNQPVAGITSTADTQGYWEVASDGGIFAFGDAQFFGSMGGHHLNVPVVGIDANPDGKGYWVVAGDGGIFAFGNADYFGSMGGHVINEQMVGIATS